MNPNNCTRCSLHSQSDEFETNIKLVHVPGLLTLIPAEQITFDTLRLILSFQNLTAFEVLHEHPVDITLEGIEELASRWQSLKKLSPNEESLVMSGDPTLDLRALIPFARHCRKLHRLGLFMNASTAKIHPAQELNPFTALSVLSIGTLQAHDQDVVAEFPSQLYPPACELVADITWTTFSSPSCRKLKETLLLEIKRRSNFWRRVRDLLPSSFEFGEMKGRNRRLYKKNLRI
ncbi:hypothetical protein K503DRAFT_866545 [Rhizopogon vinicolor AM-OR11-026]|uniref:F-box domain-containing protein n=1 Tax=Rhizopogon vinicolor AM-OR11-026 TaxID=1314800 RepID=A0A1B7MZ91_9AGAM|nr:hypothetical protein K503DRAFT_866545 [Rhizopogon vinicolor AM-OR11-026]